MVHGVIAYDVAVLTRGGKPGMLVARVKVIGPDGKARPHYAAKLVARNGRASGKFDLALNDTPGRWTVRVTDLVSRKTGAAAVTVTK